MFCMFARSESSRSPLSQMAGDFRKPWAWGASLASLFIHSTERFPMLSLRTEMARTPLSRFLPARVNQPCSRRLSSGVVILHLFEVQFSMKWNVVLFTGFIKRLLFEIYLSYLNTKFLFLISAKMNVFSYLKNWLRNFRRRNSLNNLGILIYLNSEKLDTYLKKMNELFYSLSVETCIKYVEHFLRISLNNLAVNYRILNSKTIHVFMLVVKGQFAHFEATSERDDSQTNGELNSANRTRAIGIRDLRRSEVQLVMHRTRAHLRGRRRYVLSRACWGSCANKFIYRGRRMSYMHRRAHYETLN